jgi:hypothetical protein
MLPLPDVRLSRLLAVEHVDRLAAESRRPRPEPAPTKPPRLYDHPKGAPWPPQPTRIASSS